MRYLLAAVFALVLVLLALGAGRARAYVSGEDGPAYPCYVWEAGNIIYGPWGAVQCQYDPYSSTGYAYHNI